MSCEEVSLVELEQLALGELPDPRARSIEAAATTDPELAARIARVRSDIEAARDLPELRLPEPWPAWRWAPAVTGALALAAAALLWLVPTRSEQFRGDFDLQVERLREGQPRSVGALVDVQPGDRIQYEVRPSEPGTLGVFDLQDDGELFVWLEPQPVPARTATLGAAELDDYTGTERIFFVFSAEPFTVDDIEEAVQRAWRTPLPALDTLPLDATMAQRSVMLLREEAP